MHYDCSYGGTPLLLYCSSIILKHNNRARNLHSHFGFQDKMRIFQLPYSNSLQKGVRFSIVSPDINPSIQDVALRSLEHIMISLTASNAEINVILFGVIPLQLLDALKMMMSHICPRLKYQRTLHNCYRFVSPNVASALSIPQISGQLFYNQMK